MASPLSQFEIKPILPLELAGIDVSFTNSALMMVLAVVLVTGFFWLAGRRPALVPGRLQAAAEMFHGFVAGMLRDNAGPEARPFFPFVFALFVFILLGNLLGMIPYSFTYTSHIIVTFGLAAIVFVFVTLLAIIRHGWHFLGYFMPTGAPLWLAPILIPIELISYLSRPVSLSIRLFANMMAGHTMLKVFAGFSVMLVGALGGTGLALGLLPVLINIGLTAFEILVALLQAYVFSMLTCLYIRDALELH